MLSRKEGSVGYVIFNNPERHNAVSLDMWAGGGRDPRRLPQRQRHPRRGGHRRRRQGVRVRRRHLASSRRSAPTRRRSTHYNATSRQELPPPSTSFPKPTIAMIRGYCIGGGLGLATCCDLRICYREFEVRRAGRQARARLRLCRREAAGRRGRAVLRQGDLLHGAPVHRRGGADHGPRQPGGAGRTSSRATSRTMPTRSPATRR